MRFPTSILLSLIAIGVVTSSPTGCDDTIPNPKDLKSFLDWSNDLLRIDQMEKFRYTVELENFCENIYLAEFKDIGEKVFELTSKSAELRDLLVREGASGGSVAETIRGDLSTIVYSVITMKDVFDDLKSHISEWEKVKEGDAPIEKVTDPEPLNWFKEHGFDESSLNDVTIEQLKTAVEGIVGEGNTLGRLSTFVTAAFFDQPTIQLCKRLVILFTTLGGIKFLSQTNMYVKEDDNVFRGSDMPEVLSSLSDIGAPYGMLQFFSMGGRRYPSRSDAVTHREEDVFYSEDIGKLTAMMASLSEYVPNQMRKFESFLRISCDENLDSSSGDSSRALVPSCESRKRTADQIRYILCDDGESASVLSRVRECTDMMRHGKLDQDKSRKNLRK